MFHLRRIGPRAGRRQAAHIIELHRPVTTIGRNASQVHYAINSENYQENAIISRRHARIKRTSSGYKIFDDSRNGIYVNDVKIPAGVGVTLNEGDTVTFGHLQGEELAPGAHVRQPNSQHQFIVEVCECPGSRQGQENGRLAIEGGAHAGVPVMLACLGNIASQLHHGVLCDFTNQQPPNSSPNTDHPHQLAILPTSQLQLVPASVPELGVQGSARRQPTPHLQGLQDRRSNRRHNSASPYQTPRLVRIRDIIQQRAVTDSAGSSLASAVDLAGPSSVSRELAGPSSVSRQLAGPSSVSQELAGPSSVSRELAGPSSVSRELAGPAGSSKTDQGELQDDSHAHVLDLSSRSGHVQCYAVPGLAANIVNVASLIPHESVMTTENKLMQTDENLRDADAHAASVAHSVIDRMTPADPSQRNTLMSSPQQTVITQSSEFNRNEPGRESSDSRNRSLESYTAATLGPSSSGGDMSPSTVQRMTLPLVTPQEMDVEMVRGDRLSAVRLCQDDEVQVGSDDIQPHKNENAQSRFLRGGGGGGGQVTSFHNDNDGEEVEEKANISLSVGEGKRSEGDLSYKGKHDLVTSLVEGQSGDSGRSFKDEDAPISLPVVGLSGGDSEPRIDVIQEMSSPVEGQGLDFCVEDDKIHTEESHICIETKMEEFSKSPGIGLEAAGDAEPGSQCVSRLAESRREPQTVELKTRSDVPLTGPAESELPSRCDDDDTEGDMDWKSPRSRLIGNGVGALEMLETAVKIDCEETATCFTEGSLQKPTTTFEATDTNISGNNDVGSGDYEENDNFSTLDEGLISSQESAYSTDTHDTCTGADERLFVKPKLPAMGSQSSMDECPSDGGETMSFMSDTDVESDDTLSGQNLDTVPTRRGLHGESEEALDGQSAADDTLSMVGSEGEDIPRHNTDDGETDAEPDAPGQRSSDETLSHIDDVSALDIPMETGRENLLEESIHACLATGVSVGHMPCAGDTDLDANLPAQILDSMPTSAKLTCTDLDEYDVAMDTEREVEEAVVTEKKTASPSDNSSSVSCVVGNYFEADDDKLSQPCTSADKSVSSFREEEHPDELEESQDMVHEEKPVAEAKGIVNDQSVPSEGDTEEVSSDTSLEGTDTPGHIDPSSEAADELGHIDPIPEVADELVKNDPMDIANESVQIDPSLDVGNEPVYIDQRSGDAGEPVKIDPSSEDADEPIQVDPSLEDADKRVQINLCPKVADEPVHIDSSSKVSDEPVHIDPNSEVVHEPVHIDPNSEVADEPVKNDPMDVASEPVHIDQRSIVDDEPLLIEPSPEVADEPVHIDSSSKVSDEPVHIDPNSEVVDEPVHIDPNSEVADEPVKNDPMDVANEPVHTDQRSIVDDEPLLIEPSPEVADEPVHIDSCSKVSDEPVHIDPCSEVADKPVRIDPNSEVADEPVYIDPCSEVADEPIHIDPSSEVADEPGLIDPSSGVADEPGHNDPSSEVADEPGHIDPSPEVADELVKNDAMDVANEPVHNDQRSNDADEPVQIDQSSEVNKEPIDPQQGSNDANEPVHQWSGDVPKHGLTTSEMAEDAEQMDKVDNDMVSAESCNDVELSCTVSNTRTEVAELTEVRLASDLSNSPVAVPQEGAGFESEGNAKILTEPVLERVVVKSANSAIVEIPVQAVNSISEAVVTVDGVRHECVTKVQEVEVDLGVSNPVLLDLTNMNEASCNSGLALESDASEIEIDTGSVVNKTMELSMETTDRVSCDDDDLVAASDISSGAEDCTMPLGWPAGTSGETEADHVEVCRPEEDAVHEDVEVDVDFHLSLELTQVSQTEAKLVDRDISTECEVASPEQSHEMELEHKEFNDVDQEEATNSRDPCKSSDKKVDEGIAAAADFVDEPSIDTITVTSEADPGSDVAYEPPVQIDTSLEGTDKPVHIDPSSEYADKPVQIDQHPKVADELVHIDPSSEVADEPVKNDPMDVADESVHIDPSTEVVDEPGNIDQSSEVADEPGHIDPSSEVADESVKNDPMDVADEPVHIDPSTEVADEPGHIDPSSEVADEPVHIDPSSEVANEPVHIDPSSEVADKPVHIDPSSEVADEPVHFDPSSEIADEPVHIDPSSEVADEPGNIDPSSEVADEPVNIDPSSEIVDEPGHIDPSSEVADKPVHIDPSSEVADEPGHIGPSSEVADEPVNIDPSSEIVDESVKNDPMDVADEPVHIDPSTEVADEPGHIDPSSEVADEPVHIDPSSEVANEPVHIDPSSEVADKPVHIDPSSEVADEPGHIDPSSEVADEPVNIDPSSEIVDEPGHIYPSSEVADEPVHIDPSSEVANEPVHIDPSSEVDDEPVHIDPSSEVADEPVHIDPSPEVADEPGHIDPSTEVADEPVHIDPSTEVADKPGHIDPSPKVAEEPVKNDLMDMANEPIHIDQHLDDAGEPVQIDQSSNVIDEPLQIDPVLEEIAVKSASSAITDDLVAASDILSGAEDCTMTLERPAGTSGETEANHVEVCRPEENAVHEDVEVDEDFHLSLELTQVSQTEAKLVYRDISTECELASPEQSHEMELEHEEFNDVVQEEAGLIESVNQTAQEREVGEDACVDEVCPENDIDGKDSSIDSGEMLDGDQDAVLLDRHHQDQDEADELRSSVDGVCMDKDVLPLLSEAVPDNHQHREPSSQTSPEDPQLVESIVDVTEESSRHDSQSGMEMIEINEHKIEETSLQEINEQKMEETSSSSGAKASDEHVTSDIGCEGASQVSQDLQDKLEETSQIAESSEVMEGPDNSINCEVERVSSDECDDLPNQPMDKAGGAVTDVVVSVTVVDADNDLIDEADSCVSESSQLYMDVAPLKDEGPGKMPLENDSEASVDQKDIGLEIIQKTIETPVRGGLLRQSEDLSEANSLSLVAAPSCDNDDETEDMESEYCSNTHEKSGAVTVEESRTVVNAPIVSCDISETDKESVESDHGLMISSDAGTNVENFYGSALDSTEASNSMNSIDVEADPDLGDTRTTENLVAGDPENQHGDQESIDGLVPVIIPSYGRRNVKETEFNGEGMGESELACVDDTGEKASAVDHEDPAEINPTLHAEDKGDHSAQHEEFTDQAVERVGTGLAAEILDCTVDALRGIATIPVDTTTSAGVMLTGEECNGVKSDDLGQGSMEEMDHVLDEGLSMPLPGSSEPDRREFVFGLCEEVTIVSPVKHQVCSDAVNDNDEGHSIVAEANDAMKPEVDTSEEQKVTPGAVEGMTSTGGNVEEQDCVHGEVEMEDEKDGDLCLSLELTQRPQIAPIVAHDISKTDEETVESMESPDVVEADLDLGDKRPSENLVAEDPENQHGDQESVDGLATVVIRTCDEETKVTETEFSGDNIVESELVGVGDTRENASVLCHGGVYKDHSAQDDELTTDQAVETVGKELAAEILDCAVDALTGIATIPIDNTASSGVVLTEICNGVKSDDLGQGSMEEMDHVLDEGLSMPLPDSSEPDMCEESRNVSPVKYQVCSDAVNDNNDGHSVVAEANDAVESENNASMEQKVTPGAVTSTGGNVEEQDCVDDLVEIEDEEEGDLHLSLELTQKARNDSSGDDDPGTRDTALLGDRDLELEAILTLTSPGKESALHSLTSSNGIAADSDDLEQKVTQASSRPEKSDPMTNVPGYCEEHAENTEELLDKQELNQGNDIGLDTRKFPQLKSVQQFPEDSSGNSGKFLDKIYSFVNIYHDDVPVSEDIANIKQTLETAGECTVDEGTEPSSDQADYVVGVATGSALEQEIPTVVSAANETNRSQTDLCELSHHSESLISQDGDEAGIDVVPFTTPPLETLVDDEQEASSDDANVTDKEEAGKSMILPSGSNASEELSTAAIGTMKVVVEEQHSEISEMSGKNHSSKEVLTLVTESNEIDGDKNDFAEGPTGNMEGSSEKGAESDGKAKGDIKNETPVMATVEQVSPCTEGASEPSGEHDVHNSTEVNSLYEEPAPGTDDIVLNPGSSLSCPAPGDVSSDKVVKSSSSQKSGGNEFAVRALPGSLPIGSPVMSRSGVSPLPVLSASPAPDPYDSEDHQFSDAESDEDEVIPPSFPRPGSQMSLNNSQPCGLAAASFRPISVVPGGLVRNPRSAFGRHDHFPRRTSPHFGHLLGDRPASPLSQSKVLRPRAASPAFGNSQPAKRKAEDDPETSKRSKSENLVKVNMKRKAGDDLEEDKLKRRKEHSNCDTEGNSTEMASTSVAASTGPGTEGGESQSNSSLVECRGGSSKRRRSSEGDLEMKRWRPEEDVRAQLDRSPVAVHAAVEEPKKASSEEMAIAVPRLEVGTIGCVPESEVLDPEGSQDKKIPDEDLEREELVDSDLEDGSLQLYLDASQCPGTGLDKTDVTASPPDNEPSVTKYTNAFSSPKNDLAVPLSQASDPPSQNDACTKTGCGVISRLVMTREALLAEDDSLGCEPLGDDPASPTEGAGTAEEEPQIMQSTTEVTECEKVCLSGKFPCAENMEDCVYEEDIHSAMQKQDVLGCDQTDELDPAEIFGIPTQQAPACAESPHGDEDQAKDDPSDFSEHPQVASNDSHAETKSATGDHSSLSQQSSTSCVWETELPLSQGLDADEVLSADLEEEQQGIVVGNSMEELETQKFFSEDEDQGADSTLEDDSRNCNGMMSADVSPEEKSVDPPRLTRRKIGRVPPSPQTKPMQAPQEAAPVLQAGPEAPIVAAAPANTSGCCGDATTEPAADCPSKKILQIPIVTALNSVAKSLSTETLSRALYLPVVENTPGVEVSPAELAPAVRPSAATRSGNVNACVVVLPELLPHDASSHAGSEHGAAVQDLAFIGSSQNSNDGVTSPVFPVFNTRGAPATSKAEDFLISCTFDDDDEDAFSAPKLDFSVLATPKESMSAVFIHKVQENSEAASEQNEDDDAGGLHGDFHDDVGNESPSVEQDCMVESQGSSNDSHDIFLSTPEMNAMMDTSVFCAASQLPCPDVSLTGLQAMLPVSPALKDSQARNIENCSPKPGPSHGSDPRKCSTSDDTHADIPASQISLFSQYSSQHMEAVEDLPASQRSRVGTLVEQLRLKHLLKKEAPSSDHEESGDEPMSCSQPEPPSSPSLADKAREFMDRAQRVLHDLQSVLGQVRNLRASNCLDTWRSEASSLERQISLPSCTVAVVGDTGHGKSSLLNAVLDHADILPTSGMKACTAVVMEVGDNDCGDLYEADVEFLSKKEWEQEVKLLLETLRTDTGRIRTMQPDKNRHPEVAAAWSKLRAVNGKFSPSATLQELMRANRVTRQLGKVVHIEEAGAQTFRSRIGQYVEESADPHKGGEFWPVIKKVSIRIPNCKVCRGGTVLVDLPGSRDSNAARDSIAKEYLKKCSSLLIVADITRAVHNKTAKDMLGEHFRRQLLMDGQYGNLGFICTKADTIVASEIKRALNLSAETRPHSNAMHDFEKSIRILEGKLSAKQREVEKVRVEVKRLSVEVKDSENDLLTLKEVVEQDMSCSQADLAQQLAMEDSLSQVLLDQQARLKAAQGRLSDVKKDMKSCRQEKLELVAKLEERRRLRTAVCAKARNDFSRTKIREDFRSGIREMKRQASFNPAEDTLEDDEDDEEDDFEADQMAENLSVFCVSSLDYLKLTGRLEDDGPPQVFQEAADTEIPDVKQYLQQLGERRRGPYMQQLLQSLYQLMSDIKGHLNDSGTQDQKQRQNIHDVIGVEVASLFSLDLCLVLEETSNTLRELFSQILLPKLDNGTQQGKRQAVGIAEKWGRKPNKEAPQAGGLCWSTYRATCHRVGVYTSKSYGPINFNEDLAGPMYGQLTIAWDQVFNMQLRHLLDGFRKDVCSTLKEFVKRVEHALVNLVDTSRIARLGKQLLANVALKLTGRQDQVRDEVSQRQREISRIITPSLQKELVNTYEQVTLETGSGSFERMKQQMARGVDQTSSFMYDQAATMLQDELETLQNDIVAELQKSVESLRSDVLALYQPLWESPSSTERLKGMLTDDVSRLMSRTEELCCDAQVSVDALRRQSRADSVEPVLNELDDLAMDVSQEEMSAGNRDTMSPVSPERKGLGSPVLDMPLPSGLLTPEYTPRHNDVRSGHASIAALDDSLGRTTVEQDLVKAAHIKGYDAEVCQVHGSSQPLVKVEIVRLSETCDVGNRVGRLATSAVTRERFAPPDGHTGDHQHWHLGSGDVGRGKTAPPPEGAAHDASLGNVHPTGQTTILQGGKKSVQDEVKGNIPRVPVVVHVKKMSCSDITAQSGKTSISSVVSDRQPAVSTSPDVSTTRPSPRCGTVAPHVPAASPQGAAMVAGPSVELSQRRISPWKKTSVELSQRRISPRKKNNGPLKKGILQEQTDDSYVKNARVSKRKTSENADPVGSPPRPLSPLAGDSLQCAHGCDTKRCKVCPQPSLNPAAQKIVAAAVQKPRVEKVTAGVQKPGAQKSKIFKTQARHAVMSMCMDRGKVTIHKMESVAQPVGRKKRHTKAVPKHTLSQTCSSKSQPYDFPTVDRELGASSSQPDQGLGASVRRNLCTESQRPRPLPSGSPEFHCTPSSPTEDDTDTNRWEQSSQCSKSVHQRSLLPGRHHPASSARAHSMTSKLCYQDSRSLPGDVMGVKQEPISPLQMKRKRTISTEIIDLTGENSSEDDFEDLDDELPLPEIFAPVRSSSQSKLSLKRSKLD